MECERVNTSCICNNSIVLGPLAYRLRANEVTIQTAHICSHVTSSPCVGMGAWPIFYILLKGLYLRNVAIFRLRNFFLIYSIC